MTAPCRAHLKLLKGLDRVVLASCLQSSSRLVCSGSTQDFAPTCGLVPERVDGLEAKDHRTHKGEAGQQLPPRAHQLQSMCQSMCVRGQSTLHAFNGAALWASRIRRSCMFAGHAAGADPSVIPDDGATHLTDLLAAPRGRRWRRRRWRRPVPTWPGLGSPALLASLPSIGLSGKDLRLDQSAAASPRIALPGVLLLRLRADCCTCTNRLDPPNGPAQVLLLLRRLLPAALRRRCCQGGGSSGTAKCQLHVTEPPKPLCEDSP